MVEFKLNPFKLNKSSILVPVFRAIAYKPSPLTTVYVPPVEGCSELAALSSLGVPCVEIELSSSVEVVSSFADDSLLADKVKTCPG